MFPYTGDYIEHIEKNINNFKYYTFTPRPLMLGDMYKMDNELLSLLIEAHRNIGFLTGLLKYAPNRVIFNELVLLKECAYSRMIDYDSPTFQEVIISRGCSKGNIMSINNLKLAYKAAEDKTISAKDLSKLCETALYGNAVGERIDIRDKQIFLLGVKSNLKTYNPTAPDAILPALADISAYLYNDKDTDPLIQAALVHYQFEILHPFEQYNGIVGRIMVPMIFYNTISKTTPLISLSEYLYNNKNEYFDLLRSTQYSGGYIRWIKFFVNAIDKVTKHLIELLEKYECLISKDEKKLENIFFTKKNVALVYSYFKEFLVADISSIEKELHLSFNSISKAIHILHENNIIYQEGCGKRNRIWKYTELESIFT